MSKITIEQATAMMDNGFRHGVAGYPILYSDNGKVTIVEERKTHLIVWEFDGEGNVLQRRYISEGKRNADILASR